LKGIEIKVREGAGVARVLEPIRFGVPIPQGQVTDLNSFKLSGSKSAQFSQLSRWKDGSISWVLVDALVDVPEETEALLKLTTGTTSSKHSEPKRNKNSLSFAFNPAESVLPSSFVPTFKLEESGETFSLILSIDGEKPLKVKYLKLETLIQGPVRESVSISGVVSVDAEHELSITLAIDLLKSRSLIQTKLSLLNTASARHEGGFWDLGDKGSIFLNGISLKLVPVLEANTLAEIAWASSVDQAPKITKGSKLQIYQESSGGERWSSENHINRFGVVPLRFRGYKVTAGETLEQGLRAEPTVIGRFGDLIVGAVIPNFWQKFPNSLAVDAGGVTASFLPPQFPGPVELQAGETKSGEVIFAIEKGSLDFAALAALQNPLTISLSKSTYQAADLKLSDKQDPRFENLLDLALDGPRNFFRKREAIDEYGWRNFGCTFADHEAIHSFDDAPLISHFNNQYDLTYGFGLQYLRSGDPRWFNLFVNSAEHSIDIDVYRSAGDRSAYAGGYFWHTEHYLPANTSTHRTYSKLNIGNRKRKRCGGGPANEHNYTSGLALYYLMTGSQRAKETVLQLAEWVLNMEDGAKSKFRFIDRGPTGLATQTAESGYHGPGRGAGNSVNALLDAFLLAGDRKYLLAAEKLIKRVIHPQDRISLLKLENAEMRWSYLVFLQVLVKYLSLNVASEPTMFEYARASLIHYAKWMLANETTFSEKKGSILLWTESWPAHDMRKAVILQGAARYSGGEGRKAFLAEAERYFDLSLTELWSYDTKDFTRPLSVVMTAGALYDSKINKFEKDYSDPESNWPKRSKFYPIKERILRKGLYLAGSLMGGLGVLSWLVSVK